MYYYIRAGKDNLYLRNRQDGIIALWLYLSASNRNRLRHACIAPAFKVAATIAIHVIGAFSLAYTRARFPNKAKARSMIIAAQVPAFTLLAIIPCY
jgi:hypothetical protein